MLVGAKGPAKKLYGGNTATMRSPSASTSSEEVALPTRVVSGRAPRCVGRVDDDDDFETSSYEETSDSSYSEDNSEEFVPLAFGYIKGNPKRSAGAPARGQVPKGVSEEMNSQSSLSDAMPLEIFYERANAKRTYGKGARHEAESEVTSSLSSFDDEDSSGVSDALPVGYERKKRTRTVGKVHNPVYEVSESESALSLSNEDDAPLNAQLIYTLVKRLRNPLDDVTPEAFDYVDFNDANFRDVLEPLKQIKVCLERRSSYPMKQNDEIEKAIKAAVQSLPSQKAIAVKVQTVKSRQLRPSQPTTQLYCGGESGPQNAEVLEGLVARLRNAAVDVPVHDFEKVDWADRDFEPVLVSLRQIRAYMEAKEVVRGTPAESTMKGVATLDEKIMVAILALPADEVMEAKVKTIASRPMSHGPSNGEAIRELMHKLKEPGQQVPVSAFEKLDWNDAQFSRELEPLIEIRAFMEVRECIQYKPGEKMMDGTKAVDDKIKTATMFLPAQKEMAAKVQAVKSRQLRMANGQSGARSGGESAPATVDKAKTAVASAPAEKPKEAAVRTVRSRPMSRAPTNGEEILNLIKRLKNPEEQVPLRAFDQLDWNDRNFARELEPLQQIRMYMEAKETIKRMPAEKKQSGVPDFDNKIKTAILSLPPEKAVAVKIQMLKERSMAPEDGAVQPQAVKVGKLSAPAGTVKKMRDSIIIAEPKRKSKTKEGKLSASSSQVMQVGAKVISANAQRWRTKESTALSEPAKKVRRARHNGNNRSVSFLKMEEPVPGEIVDVDQILAEASGPQRLQDEARSSPQSTTPRDISRVPSRPAHAQGRRSRQHRLNQTVSFSEFPHEEAGIIKEEDENLSSAKRKVQRRRGPHKPGRNLSISSLPDMEDGEVVEDPTLPDKPASRAVEGAPTPPSVKPTLKPRGAAKKRRPRAHNNNNRSCSFSQVAMEEAKEMPDMVAGTLKGAAEDLAAAARAEAAPSKPTRKLVRRRRPGEEGGTLDLEKGSPALDKDSPSSEKGAEASDAASVRKAPPSRGKGRRPNVTQPRSANTSMVEDEPNGEIVELLDEADRLYTSSGKASPMPEHASATRTKSHELPAATRAVKGERKTSETGAAPRKRRQRLHVSKELSISAIPEDKPGEIVEDERDTFAETAGPESLTSTMRRSLQANGGGRTFPRVGSASRRGSMRGALHSSDRPISSARSSLDGPKAAFAPEAEPSVMTDTSNTSHLPSPHGLRRSAEPTTRVVKPVAKAANGATRIPPLRSSR